MTHFTDQIAFETIITNAGEAFAYAPSELGGDVVVVDAAAYAAAFDHSDYSFWCSATTSTQLPSELIELVGVQYAFDLIAPDDSTDGAREARMCLIDELLRSEGMDGWRGVADGYVAYLGDHVADELEALRAGTEDTLIAELAYYLDESQRSDGIDYQIIQSAVGIWYMENRPHLIEALEAELTLG